MTHFTDVLSTANGEVPLPESIILAATAQQAVEPKKLTPNTPYALLQADGSLKIEVTEHESPKPLADHVKATRTVADADSFIAYVARHYDPGTEVYASLSASTVTALIDGPTATDPDKGRDRAGHEEHILSLRLEKTPSWNAWLSKNGQWLSQVDFAEHLEDNLSDIVEPAAADMLELAQTFQATRGVEFKSSQRLSTGETTIAYAESTDAKAGRSGNLSIPERFKLALIPFVGGETAYAVNARFRYRLRDGDLALAYKLDRPERVLEDAFKDVLEAIKTGIEFTEVPVFHGNR